MRGKSFAPNKILFERGMIRLYPSILKVALIYSRRKIPYLTLNIFSKNDYSLWKTFMVSQEEIYSKEFEADWMGPFLKKARALKAEYTYGFDDK